MSAFRPFRKTRWAFFSKNFVSATGNYDIYALFVERGLTTPKARRHPWVSSFRINFSRLLMARD